MPINYVLSFNVHVCFKFVLLRQVLLNFISHLAIYILRRHDLERKDFRVTRWFYVSSNKADRFCFS